MMVALSATLFSCGGGSSVKLSTLNDSLSYAISVAKTEGLSDVMYQQLGVDSAYVEEFVKGVRAAFIPSTDPKDMAYKAGLQIGLQAERVCESANMEVYPNDTVNSISKEIFLEGLVAGILGDTTIMSFEDGKAYYMQVVYIQASDDFLAANKDKEGVITTESGLQYRIIEEGDVTKKAAATDSVKCIYKGTLINGRTFDTSRGKPVTFAVNRVIPGWTEALQMMGKGAKWQLFIPWNLAYGENGTRGIPPYSTLIFDVEVVDIISPKTK